MQNTPDKNALNTSVFSPVRCKKLKIKKQNIKIPFEFSF